MTRTILFAFQLAGLDLLDPRVQEAKKEIPEVQATRGQHIFDGGALLVVTRRSLFMKVSTCTKITLDMVGLVALSTFITHDVISIVSATE